MCIRLHSKTLEFESCREKWKTFIGVPRFNAEQRGNQTNYVKREPFTLLGTLEL